MGEDACMRACSSLQSCPMDCSQPPLSMEFSRQEYWGGLLCPPLEDLSNPGIEPTSPMSPELSGGFSIGPWEWVLSVRLRPRR